MRKKGENEAKVGKKSQELAVNDKYGGDKGVEKHTTHNKWDAGSGDITPSAKPSLIRGSKNERGLTFRQQKFANHFAQHGNICAAVRFAGYTDEQQARQALNRSAALQAEILRIRSELADNAAAIASVSPEWVLAKMKNLAERCGEPHDDRGVKAPASAVRATELIGRQIGAISADKAQQGAAGGVTVNVDARYMVGRGAMDLSFGDASDASAGPSDVTIDVDVDVDDDAAAIASDIDASDASDIDDDPAAAAAAETARRAAANAATQGASSSSAIPSSPSSSATLPASPFPTDGLPPDMLALWTALLQAQVDAKAKGKGAQGR